MANDDWLAERFDENRTHLRSVAVRMLGSPTEADDAVQEAWLRVSRSDASVVDNLGGWLTTIVARVCLDMLRSRKSRAEKPFDLDVPEPIENRVGGTDPEHDVLLADAVGPALQVVLETLAPAERVAFVLHDVFAVSFDEIAPVVGRSPAAARQLASRARRRVQGAATEPVPDLDRQRKIVDAFLAAARGGDFATLLEVLDPDVVLRADDTVARAGVSREIEGAPRVAGFFSGRAAAAQPALIDGVPGLVWAPRGQPRVAFCFTFVGERIVEIELIGDRARVRQLDLTILDAHQTQGW